MPHLNCFGLQSINLRQEWHFPGREHVSVKITLRTQKEIHLADIDKALKQLSQSSPPIKKRVLEACIACIGADGVANVKEVELLRAIVDALDCPVPPFLPGQKI